MLLYEKITKVILDASIEVHKSLGTGLLEKNYENALLHELKLRNLKCDNQVPIALYYKNVNIGNYFVDILVENKIVLEIKSVNILTKEHYAQTIHYLNAATYNLGILINFGTRELQFKRILRK